MAKRRIMREFTLHEISAVDRPAQEGAKAMIIKRAGPLSDQVAKYFIDPANGAVSFETALRQSMESEAYYNAMRVIGSEIEALSTSLRSILGDSNLDYPSKQTMLRNAVEDFMAVARSKWPDIESALQNVVTEGEYNMTTMKTVEQLSAENADLNKRLETSTSALAVAQDQVTKAEAAARKQQLEFEKVADGLKEQIKLLKARSEMKDEEKEYADRIEDEDEKKKFIFSSPAEKWATLKRAEENDEILKVDGKPIRKSVVGATQFGIMKAQQTRIDELNKSAQEAIEKAETQALVKMAEDQFNHLPGTIEAKVAALRHIEKIGEQVVKVKDAKGNEVDVPIRKTIYDMLGAGNQAQKNAFGRLGSRGGDEVNKGGNGPSAYEKRVDEIMASNAKMSKTDAMRKARLEYPKEFAEYQASGENQGQHVSH